VRRIAAALFALLALASPAAASVRACTTALVTAGLCNSTSDVLVSYSLPTTDPDGAGPRVSIRDQIVEGCALTFGYSALVNGSANPETKAAYCDRVIRTVLFSAWASKYYDSLAETAKQTTLTGTQPDIVP